MKNLHLTINNFSDTSITTSQWPIRGEPQRVGVKMGNKEYVIVLDDIPYFEVWSLDKNGELLDLENTIPTKDYPFFHITGSFSENTGNMDEFLKALKHEFKRS